MPTALRSNAVVPLVEGQLTSQRQAAEAHAADGTVAERITCEYGPLVQPSAARAQRAYLQECNHHVMFSIKHTSLADLLELGLGHQLYFMFLWYIALSFGALTLTIGIPFALTYAINGNFFSSGFVNTRLTLGNYGPVYAEGIARANGMVRPAAAGCLAILRTRLPARPSLPQLRSFEHRDAGKELHVAHDIVH